jgi:hypothetical protein
MRYTLKLAKMLKLGSAYILITWNQGLLIFEDMHDLPRRSILGLRNELMTISRISTKLLQPNLESWTETYEFRHE